MDTDGGAAPNYDKIDIISKPRFLGSQLPIRKEFDFCSFTNEKASKVCSFLVGSLSIIYWIAATRS